jgi:HK97 gp10 family phage protein
MPQITMTIKNMAAFQAALGQSPQIVSKHLQKAISLSSVHFLSAVKQNIRTGTDMWKPPIDTGYMWNTIFSNVFPLKTEIYATADYAVYVHEGTSKMRARPFFTITAEREEKAIDKIFTDELNAALQEVSRA